MFDVGTQEALRTPFPPSAIRQRKIPGGKLIDYVEAADVIARLNDVFGASWSFEIVNSFYEEARSEVLVVGRMTVQDIHHDAYGAATLGRYEYGEQKGEILPEALGNAYKSAVSDTIKLCAKQFGVGLHLWQSDETLPESTQSGTPAQQATEDTLWKATDKQKEFMQSLDSKLSTLVEGNVSLHNEVLAAIAESELSTKAASALIAKLLAAPKKAA